MRFPVKHTTNPDLWLFFWKAKDFMPILAPNEWDTQFLFIFLQSTKSPVSGDHPLFEHGPRFPPPLCVPYGPLPEVGSGKVGGKYLYMGRFSQGGQ